MFMFILYVYLMYMWKLEFICILSWASYCIIIVYEYFILSKHHRCKIIFIINYLFLTRILTRKVKSNYVGKINYTSIRLTSYKLADNTESLDYYYQVHIKKLDIFLKFYCYIYIYYFKNFDHVRQNLETCAHAFAYHISNISLKMCAHLLIIKYLFYKSIYASIASVYLHKFFLCSI